MAKGRLRKSGRGAIIFLVLFALPFAGAGTFVGYLAGSMVAAWTRAQSWEEVPARILSADLETHHGDDSTTYEVVATYEYSYMGTRYTSDEVGLGFGSDNIGSFHQDAYRELGSYVGNDRSFRCFVNPADPGQALLYRDMRWGLLGLEVVFALAFAGVGYGLIFAAIYGGRRVAADEQRKLEQPDEPWLWKREWSEGRIHSTTKGRMIGAFLFASFWNLISVPLFFLIPREVAGGNRMALLGLLFPAAGALLATWAGYTLLQWRKFGSSVFEMDRVPALLGGHLEGRIHTNIRAPLAEGVELTLACIRRETTGSGKNRTTREKLLWQDAMNLGAGSVIAGPQGVNIPVRFGIPYDAGPASDPEGNDLEWRLSAEAEMPGVDFAAHFALPVFATEDSDPDLAFEVVPDQPAAGPDPLEALRGQGILTEPLPSGGRSWVFRRARALVPALGLGVFLAVWCGFIWIMLVLDAPFWFPLVFGLFALLIGMGLLDLLLTERRVEIENGALTATTRILGFRRRRTFSRDEIATLEPDSGMQAGNTLYYRIRLVTRAGKKHVLAAQLSNQRLAKRLIETFEAALAEEPGGDHAQRGAHHTMRNTEAGAAPSAMRVPISRRRRATE